MFNSLISDFDKGTYYGRNADTVRKEFLFGKEVRAVIYYINGFGNGVLMEKLLSFMMNLQNAATLVKKGTDAFLLSFLPYAELSVCSLEKGLTAVYTGNAILVVDGIEHYIAIDTKKYPIRGIEEPSKDKVLRGAKDGFVESLITNSALIRRRIRDNRLIFEKITVGSRTRTDIFLCYIEGMADAAYLNRLRDELKGIQISGLNMGEESLQETLIRKKWYNPFPKIRYTERPDTASAMLMEGSVIILCDNDPSAMILPTSIFDYLQDTNDFYFTPLVGSYLKLVRNMVYMLSVLLTPVWFTLQKYPDILPDFLVYEGESFLPLIWQLLLVEISVDGLKLASLNTPDTLSNSLSVISALILGNLAISVGWLSEQVLLYMAFVAIANFAQPSFELAYAFKFMRLLTLIFIQFFGIYGLALGVVSVIILIATNNTVASGKGYCYPLIPFNGRALMRLFLRVRLKNGVDANGEKKKFDKGKHL